MRDKELLFYEAVKNAEVELVKELLTDSEIDPSAKWNFALKEAAANGSAEIVQLFLADSRTNPNGEPLTFAAKNGHAAVVKLLLADRRLSAIGNKQYREAMFGACINGHREVVKHFLDSGKIDPNGLPLKHASENGRVAVVKLLLSDDRIVEKKISML